MHRIKLIRGLLGSTKSSQVKEQRLQLDDEPLTDYDATSTSSRDCPALPSWRIEHFLVQELQDSDWWCRSNEDSSSNAIFFNRGEDLWHCTREAWLERVVQDDAPRAKPLSRKGTRALVDFMKEKQGPHPLPRRLPLSSMVKIFHQHVWDDIENSDDDSKMDEIRESVSTT